MIFTLEVKSLRQRVREKDMTTPVKRYFCEKGYVASEEIPIGRKRIDLVFINKTSADIIAVELKIRDWRKAFRQALQNTFLAHRSYLALRNETITTEEKGMIKGYGIGVLRVRGESVKEIISPKKTFDGLSLSMKKILEYVKNKENCRFVWE